MSLFECVPNFSEGRDAAKIARIADAGRDVAGVTVLDVESNADHNRSVISLVGEGAPLSEAVLRMARTAVELIDLNEQRGEHPRMGAVDVVPFVPIGSSTMEEAVALAVAFGERLWKELRVPVYLYGAAARRPDRSDLAVVRKGEFEGIRDSIATDGARRPDFGDAAVHPTAGATAVGARPVLIAFNAYLATPDVAVAKKVARAVRGRDGGLAEVKALGFEIKERNRAQVSMNLTDYRRTPVHRAMELVRREAARYGTHVEEGEVVGLIPEDALFDAAEFYLQLNRFDRATILERKVRGTPGSSETPGFTALSLGEFVGRIAARTPTPGGGSASAAAGAIGVALGEMVISYSIPKGGSDPRLHEPAGALAVARARFLALVDEDAASFEAVRSARQEAKASGGDVGGEGVRAALLGAAKVPLETARLARECEARLAAVESALKTALRSDYLSARALLRACRQGALSNVAANLEELKPLDEAAAAVAREADLLRSDS